MLGENLNKSKAYALGSEMAWPKDFEVLTIDQLKAIDHPQIEINLWATDWQEGHKSFKARVIVHYHNSSELSPEILDAATQLIHQRQHYTELLKQATKGDLEQQLLELENELAKTEVRLSELMEKNYNTVMIRDESGRISFINAAIEKTIGLKPEELIGQNSFDFVHPDDQESLGKALNEVLKEDKPYAELKLRVRHREGHYVWIQSQIKDHRNTPGINGILSSFINIDEQMQAIQDLKASNQRFKYSSKATKDVIWDWDIINKTIVWGENLYPTFGYNDAEMRAESAFVSQIHPEDRDEFNSTATAAVESGKELWYCQYRFKAKTGEYRFIKDQGYIIRDAQGKALRLIGAMHDDTLRKEYEERLKAEETKFRQLFDDSLVGMLMMDLNSLDWLDCNQALLNILGYRKNEFLATSLRDLVPEKHYKLNLHQINQLRETNRIEPYQTNLVRRDLSETTVVISAFTSAYKEEHFAWIHVLDLGPIEKSTLALAEAEARFKHYIEKSSDVFVTLNNEAKYDYASPNIEHMLGYRPSEIIGMDNLSLMHPDDVEQAAAAFQKALDEPGKVTRSVFRAKHKNGSWLWVESNGKIELNNGKLKAYINVRDIQKEHEIEAELRKLSLVANRTSNAVIITNKKQKIEWVNHSFTEMSGYSLEEAQGNVLSDLVHGPLSEDIFSQKIEGLLKAEKPFTAQNVNYRKSGEHYWIESIVTPVFDDNGKLTNYIAIETDISQRKREENTMQDYMKVINTQNERLRNLAHIITHNFRSHASNIIQLLTELEHEENKEEKELLYYYLNQSSQQLLESLNETSQVLNQEVEKDLPMEACNLKDCCLKVEQSLINEIKKTQAKLSIGVPSDFQLNFYPPYLDSVMFNLISNALRYHDPQKKPEIFINLRESEYHYIIDVQDNGLGINLDKYGDRLFKLKQSFHNHPESSGIGLYLIRSQLESMGCEIKVESEEGLGSTFSVYFPK